MEDIYKEVGTVGDVYCKTCGVKIGTVVILCSKGEKYVYTRMTEKYKVEKECIVEVGSTGPLYFCSEKCRLQYKYPEHREK